ncbi:MAG: NUDIX domain-containing protein [Clostridia bacterium]|nr:NUDIX domain-containing protein [Clostridia bacterium]
MELLDVYDNNGKVTGRVVVRGDKTQVLNDNEHIAVGVIFIQNSKGEFLIQKTSKEKGGEYTSTGGHVDSGETPLQSIKREVKEELGLNVDDDNIVELGYLLYDRPIRFMFYLKKDVDIKNLKLQQEEVESAEFMSVDKIKDLIDQGLMLVSHAKIFNKVLEYLEEIK